MVKPVLPLAATIFPNHPHAAQWKSEFMRFWNEWLDVYTRRADPRLNTQGGRWMENIACYWIASLRHAVVRGRRDDPLRRHADLRPSAFQGPGALDAGRPGAVRRALPAAGAHRRPCRGATSRPSGCGRRRNCSRRAIPARPAASLVPDRRQGGDQAGAAVAAVHRLRRGAALRRGRPARGILDHPAAQRPRLPLDRATATVRSTTPPKGSRNFLQKTNPES